jgi:Zinc finger, C2H2 type
MSKELVTHVWCDHHEQAKEEQVPGASHSISVDRLEVEIDLCPECETPVTELATWLETYGRIQGRKGTRLRGGESPDAEACPLCSKLLASHDGVMAHMRNRHGTTLNEYLAQQAGEDLAELGHVCAECGRAFSTAQGRAVHQRRSHQATRADTAQ